MNKVMQALAVAAIALPIAGATDPPALKEGLWSVQGQSINNPGDKKSEATYTLCRDHAYDQSVRDREKNLKGCTTVSESFQDGKYSSEIRCTAGKIAIESKGITTFQGDTSVHSESHVTYAPPLGGTSESTIVRDEKYVGACPAGSQPGDRTNPDGTVINLGKQ
jgi:hypothetical protein